MESGELTVAEGCVSIMHFILTWSHNVKRLYLNALQSWDL